MVTFDFPPLTNKVKVIFECPKCGEQIESDWLGVPSANYDGDNHDDSLCTEDYEVVCPKCGAQDSVTVGESIYGGEGFIEELPDDAVVDVKYESTQE